MDSLQSLIHQFEGSIRKIDRAKADGELSFDNHQSLYYLLQAARVIVSEIKKKSPKKEESTESSIQIMGMPNG